MTARLKERDLCGLARVLRAEKDPERFAASVKRIEGMTRFHQARGVRVMGAANRVFLDTVRFRSLAVQDALNAPFTMVPWDRASFITYRYRASRPYYRAMVSHYAALACRTYGPRASLDLGLMGDHRALAGFLQRAEQSGDPGYYLGFLEGMGSAAELEDAVSTALTFGVRHLNLFSLDGAAASPIGVEGWLSAAARARPRPRWKTWTPLHAARLKLALRAHNLLFRMLVGGADYTVPLLPETE
jgi:hypothetical protein